MIAEQPSLYRSTAQILTALEGLLDAVETLRNDFSRAPAPGSIAADELDRQAELADDWGATVVANAQSLVWMREAAAEGHIRGFLAVVAAKHTFPNTLDVLTRAAVENLARALWVGEEAIGRDERVARCESDRLYSFDELAKLDSSYRPQAKQRREAILQSAANHGFSIIKPRKGKNPATLRIRPTATALCKQLMLDTDDNGVGTFAYRLLSASEHGTTYALVRYVQRLDDQPADSDLGAVTVTSRDVIANAHLLLLALVGFLNSWFTYLGWRDHDVWQRSLANAFAATPGPPTQR